MIKIILSIFVFLYSSLNPIAVRAVTNVAEINGIQYETISDAIASAKEGETLNLLTDVTENVVLDKNIILDGGNKHTIFGLTTAKEGTIQNVTLKPNPEDGNGSLLSVGNTSKTKIVLENVTLHYSVTKRAGGSASTVSGNNADITINHSRFMNTPNNNGAVIDASEWSYGLYVNGQGNEGSIKFTNNEFNGAFRTMLANISGNFLIENCSFTNSVYTVINGPTSGAGSEATVLTTSLETNNHLVVRKNTFNNAGAIYLQTQIDFQNNKVIADGIMHYIQAKGSIGETIDFSQNTFETGDNHYVIIDVPNTKVRMPAGMKVIDYWVWYDTPSAIRPANNTDYLYMYNEDGNITYTPQSNVALEQFLNQNNGNKQVTNNDIVLIEKDLSLGNIEVGEDRIIQIKVEDKATLEVAGDVNLLGTLDIDGKGTFRIGEGANLSVKDTGTLNVDYQTGVENNGKIVNEGTVLIPDHIGGSGSIDGNGSINKYPTIDAKDITLAVGDTFEQFKDVTAADYEDGDITKDLEVIYNSVDTSKVGTYEVTYKVADQQGAVVTKTIKVTVYRGKSSIVIQPKSLDKVYDGKAMADPEVSKIGSSGTVTFEWYVKEGESWVELQNAPTEVGSYKVSVLLAEDENYEAASIEKEFKITPKKVIVSWPSNILIYTAKPQTITPTLQRVVHQDVVDVIWSEMESNTQTDVGEYTLEIMGLTNKNYELDKTTNKFNFKIQYLQTSENISLSGTKPKEYYTSDVVLSAPNGYKLLIDGQEIDQYLWNKEGKGLSIPYSLKQIATGYITGTLTQELNVDKTAPTINIELNNNPIRSLLNTLTGNRYFKDYVDVEITAYDEVSGVDKIYYRFANGDGLWTEYKQPLHVEAGFDGIVDIKAIDFAGNIIETNSDHIQVYQDATASDHQTFTRLSKNDLLTAIDVKGNEIDRILLDGKAIDEKAYTVFQGSKIVFTNEYLSQLPAGTYEFTVEYKSHSKDEMHKSNNSMIQLEVIKNQTTLTVNVTGKEYDGHPIHVTVQSNRENDYTFKYINLDTKEIYTTAPVNAGRYYVVVSMAENDDYEAGTSEEVSFEITKASNAWTEALTINGWIYGNPANKPSAASKFGDEVIYTYSDSENGLYTSKVPTNAGTYYVKATVEDTENYSGLETMKQFMISKADPIPDKIEGIVIGKGKKLDTIPLPEGFTWKDGTVIADELGTHSFKAIYTPKDTENYNVIEVDIELQVVPVPVQINSIPTILAEDVFLTVGDSFDVLKGVTAIDQEDGDITKKIEVIRNTVEPSKVGIYEVTYKVTDSQGASVTKTIKVTVEQESVILPDMPDGPATGDSTNIYLYVSLLVISGLILCVVAMKKNLKKIYK